MKKRLSLLLSLLLLLSCGASLSEKKDDAAVLQSYARVMMNMNRSMMSEAPAEFKGKAVIAVYYSTDSSPVLYSPADSGHTLFSDIPREYLAESLNSADWAFLVYYDIQYDEDEFEEPLMEPMVFAVNIKKGTFFKPYPNSSRITCLELDGEGTVQIDDTFDFSVYDVALPMWRAEYGYDAEYRMGLKYLEEEKYYSASAAFSQSYDERAEEMALSCARPWPKNGEVWRNPDYKGGSMKLTFKVNLDSDVGYAALMYKKDVLISRIFIAGGTSATVRLPGGKYTILEGSGRHWYGIRELFGPNASYGTMAFGEDGVTEYYLEPGGDYVITVNASQRSPDSTNIDTLYMDWYSLTD